MASLTPDEKWMRRALDLAEEGRGWTMPNPMVGCVVVRDGKLLGEGFHARAGQAHAEVKALADVQDRGNDAKDSTLYVTLEPCSTHGRTPPCTQAILRAGVGRVVMAMVDPNPAHAGAAVEVLEKEGVEVTLGTLEDEARMLNRSFCHWIQTRRPWVLLKLAVTADDYVALPQGEGQWISSEASRRDVHRLRAQCGAILVGGGTVRADDPRLTVRGVDCLEQPLRVVWTRSPLPVGCRLLNDEHRERTLVFEGDEWSEMLKDLGGRSVVQLMLEGGAWLAQQWMDAGLVDEVVVYRSSRNLGGEGQGLPRVQGWDSLKFERTWREVMGDDEKFCGIVERS